MHWKNLALDVYDDEMPEEFAGDRSSIVPIQGEAKDRSKAQMQGLNIADGDEPPTARSYTARSNMKRSSSNKFFPKVDDAK